MAKILIVEDELSIAELEKDYLERAGHEVVIETTGDGGLKTALEKDIDLIILDLMLPGISGIEVCKKVREEKDMPILMISAKKDDTDKIIGLGMGADDYMTKPFSFGEMVARVNAHLSRYERLKGSNEQKNEILTAKEFDLLTFLAEHPNRVFTKDELFTNIWGMESIGDIATVTVHIKKIREKIEYSSSNPQYIETIWGVGYRFKV